MAQYQRTLIIYIIYRCVYVRLGLQTRKFLSFRGPRGRAIVKIWSGRKRIIYIESAMTVVALYVVISSRRIFVRRKCTVVNALADGYSRNRVQFIILLWSQSCIWSPTRYINYALKITYKIDGGGGKIVLIYTMYTHNNNYLYYAPVNSCDAKCA